MDADDKKAIKTLVFCFCLATVIVVGGYVLYPYASNMIAENVCGENQSLIIYLGLLSDEQPRWECMPIIPYVWVEYDSTYYNGIMNNGTVGE